MILATGTRIAASIIGVYVAITGVYVYIYPHKCAHHVGIYPVNVRMYRVSFPPYPLFFLECATTTIPLYYPNLLYTNLY